jgi:hypothetical protein
MFCLNKVNKSRASFLNRKGQMAGIAPPRLWYALQDPSGRSGQAEMPRTLLNLGLGALPPPHYLHCDPSRYPLPIYYLPWKYRFPTFYSLASIWTLLLGFYSFSSNLQAFSQLGPKATVQPILSWQPALC